MRLFTLGVTPRIVKGRRYLVEGDWVRVFGMLLARYVVRVALVVAVAAASFAAGMVVMETSSKTGNHPLYFAVAMLIVIGALLLSALVSYRVVVEKVVVGIVGRYMRSSKLKTSP